MLWILYALGSALCAALMTIFAKLSLTKIDVVTATTLRAGIMVLFLLTMSIVLKKPLTTPSFFTNRDGWLLIASALSGALSWLLYFAALQTGPTTTVATLDRTSILFVALLSTLFLSEHINTTTIMGMICILAGSFLMLSSTN